MLSISVLDFKHVKLHGFDGKLTKSPETVQIDRQCYDVYECLPSFIDSKTTKYCTMTIWYTFFGIKIVNVNSLVCLTRSDKGYIEYNHDFASFVKISVEQLHIFLESTLYQCKRKQNPISWIEVLYKLLFTQQ